MSGAAQYEREMLIERTKEGNAVARTQGKRICRPPKLTAVQLFDAHYRIATRQATRVQIAAERKIARWSLTRALKRSVEAPPN